MFNKTSTYFDHLKKYDVVENCYYLYDYFPYKNWDRFEKEGRLTVEAKSQSRLIMDLKMSECCYKKERAIDNIVGILNDLISGNEKTYICVVPSSKLDASYHGITLVTNKLCTLNNNFINGLDIIIKTHETPTLHESIMQRDYKMLKESLSVKKNLVDKKILLLDDVITTGGSVKTTRDLLQEKNAAELYILAISKTIS